MEVLVPFARPRTPAAEPVPGVGLDAPPPLASCFSWTWIQIFYPGFLAVPLPYQNVTDPKALALSQVGYSRDLWRNDASLVAFIPRLPGSHAVSERLLLVFFSCSRSFLENTHTLRDAKKPHT